VDSIWARRGTFADPGWAIGTRISPAGTVIASIYWAPAGDWCDDGISWGARARRLCGPCRALIDCCAADKAASSDASVVPLLAIGSNAFYWPIGYWFNSKSSWPVPRQSESSAGGDVIWFPASCGEQSKRRPGISRSLAYRAIRPFRWQPSGVSGQRRSDDRIIAGPGSL